MLGGHIYPIVINKIKIFFIDKGNIEGYVYIIVKQHITLYVPYNNIQDHQDMQNKYDLLLLQPINKKH